MMKWSKYSYKVDLKRQKSCVQDRHRFTENYDKSLKLYCLTLLLESEYVLIFSVTICLPSSASTFAELSIFCPKLYLTSLIYKSRNVQRGQRAIPTGLNSFEGRNFREVKKSRKFAKLSFHVFECWKNFHGYNFREFFEWTFFGNKNLIKRQKFKKKSKMD